MSDKSHQPSRVFFALWPDEAALNALSALAEAGVGRCGGRPMRRDSLHLTLLFIGAVRADKLDSLRVAASRVRAMPFEMTLDRLGWWPHNQILWAGCHEVPSCQRRLFDGLRREVVAAGFKLDGPSRASWVPHVTLARHAHCDGLPALDVSVRWQVREFALVESFLQPSGARYRTLERWPLRESA